MHSETVFYASSYLSKGLSLWDHCKHSGWEKLSVPVTDGSSSSVAGEQDMPSCGFLAQMQ